MYLKIYFGKYKMQSYLIQKYTQKKQEYADILESTAAIEFIPVSELTVEGFMTNAFQFCSLRQRNAKARALALISLEKSLFELILASPVEEQNRLTLEHFKFLAEQAQKYEKIEEQEQLDR